MVEKWTKMSLKWAHESTWLGWSKTQIKLGYPVNLKFLKCMQKRYFEKIQTDTKHMNDLDLSIKP